MASASSANSGARGGKCSASTAAAEEAAIVWPDGKEKRSGGSTWNSGCGPSSHGRGRLMACFRTVNAAIETAAADQAGHAGPRGCRRRPRQHGRQRGPAPSVAETRGRDHGPAEPARRVPVPHAPRDAQVGVADVREQGVHGSSHGARGRARPEGSGGGTAAARRARGPAEPCQPPREGLLVNVDGRGHERQQRQRQRAAPPAMKAKRPSAPGLSAARRERAR